MAQDHFQSPPDRKKGYEDLEMIPKEVKAARSTAMNFLYINVTQMSNHVLAGQGNTCVCCLRCLIYHGSVFEPHNSLHS